MRAGIRHKDPSKVVRDRAELERLVSEFKGEITKCPPSMRRENHDPLYCTRDKPPPKRQRKRGLRVNPAAIERRNVIIAMLTSLGGATGPEIKEELGLVRAAQVRDYARWYNLEIVREAREGQAHPVVRYWAKRRSLERVNRLGQPNGYDDVPPGEAAD